jgi:hypothetical protein
MQGAIAGGWGEGWTARPLGYPRLPTLDTLPANVNLRARLIIHPQDGRTA